MDSGHTLAAAGSSLKAYKTVLHHHVMSYSIQFILYHILLSHFMSYYIMSYHIISYYMCYLLLYCIIQRYLILCHIRFIFKRRCRPPQAAQACDGALVPVTLGHVKDPGELLVARFLAPWR